MAVAKPMVAVRGTAAADMKAVADTQPRVADMWAVLVHVKDTGAVAVERPERVDLPEAVQLLVVETPEAADLAVAAVAGASLVVVLAAVAVADSLAEAVDEVAAVAVDSRL